MIKNTRFLLVILALWGIQAEAQQLTGDQLAAYNNLLSGLEAGAGTESGDEALVQAARAAGLPENAIAGALAESGRSSDQQAAALIPQNPTAAQVQNAQTAMLNASNSQGTNVATVTPINVGSAIAGATPLGVPLPAPPTGPNLAVNLLSPTAAGNPPLPGLPGAQVVGAGGPIDLTEIAFDTGTPVIPTTNTETGIDTPVIIIDPEPSIHGTL